MNKHLLPFIIRYAADKADVEDASENPETLKALKYKNFYTMFNIHKGS